MKNKSILIILIQSILIISLMWIIIILGEDKIFLDHKQTKEENLIIDYTESEDGLTFVKLPISVEKNSNIQYEPILLSSHNQDIPSYGITVNLKELFETKNQLSNFSNQINKLNAQLKESKEHLTNLIILNQDDKNISDTVIHDKKIDINNLINDLEMLENNKESLLISIQHQWGSVFNEILLNPKTHELKNILSDKYRLVKITIASNNIPNDIQSNINISLSNNNEILYKAIFVSEAPDVDEALQGKSYFYIVKNNQLKIGSKIKTSITKNQNKQNKQNNYLFIPKESIVWSNGKAWAYIKDKIKDRFMRKPLPKMSETTNGWIIKQGIFKENENIVIDGAQLLLSEEFKYQIKNENED